MDKPTLFLTKNFGVVLGSSPQHAPHRHFSIQLTISDQPFVVHTDQTAGAGVHALSASNVMHHISLAAEQRLLVINTNPLSELGFGTSTSWPVSLSGPERRTLCKSFGG
jgi:hypothetical protein